MVKNLSETNTANISKKPQWFFEKNTYLLNHQTNRPFEEILWMSKEEFRNWAIELRKAVVYAWDVLGIPPRVGYSEEEMIEQFRKMESFPTNEFISVDEMTGERNLIRNTNAMGNAVNQFFPSMMATRINYTKDVDSGRSIYDYFSKDELLETFITYATRHFKRDSFYHYSLPALKHQKNLYTKIPYTHTGFLWIQEFEKFMRSRGEFDYWLAPVKDDKEYTGYAEHLKHTEPLTLNRKEIEELVDIIPEKCKTNIDWERSETYQIRYFNYGNKLFPIGFKAFRVSYCQYAVNFPPLTAKYLYDRFTEEFKHETNIYVWDPSSGWGGRLLGSLTTKDDRFITYLGNDPNTDHNTSPGRTKYHEIYDFYVSNINKGGLWETAHNGFKFWQLGSEVMHENPEFQEYRGKISVVFTSPPYFAKEAYSEDPEQSYKKFSNYDSWRDNFLKRTLQTAVEWLRPGGYLLWNIADATFAGDLLPLEEDSCNIIKELGMIQLDTIKMTLGQMPGSGRVDVETGKPKFKNACKTNGILLKYEPIFVFQKPK